jgi:hypothetical protein
MSNTILSTKLYSPPLRPNLVLRPRLTEQLARGVTYPLTLIAAPAGFGKSTLLSEWLHQRAGDAKRGNRGTEENVPPAPLLTGSPIQFAWLSLDEADNDPVRFLTYVICALETVSPGLNVDALALLQSPQPPPLPAILPILINNLNNSPQHLVLVLDDYHVITTSAIHEALIFLLDHLPPQLRLILASRTDPPLPLACWRGRNQLYELRAHDLRFTTAEATAFLEQVTGLSLPAEVVTALEQRTEGWIAGLQLAALSMQGRVDLAGFIEAFTGSHRYIVDYCGRGRADGRIAAPGSISRHQVRLCQQIVGCVWCKGAGERGSRGETKLNPAPPLLCSPTRRVAHPPRTGTAPPPRRRLVEPGNCRGTVPGHRYGQKTPQQYLWQARCQQPYPGRCPRPRTRPALNFILHPSAFILPK